MKKEDIIKEIDDIKWNLRIDSAWLTPQTINTLVDKIEQFRTDIDNAYAKKPNIN